MDKLTIGKIEQLTDPPRPIIRVPRNETPNAKLYRVVVATVRAFARDYPAEIVEIVKEEVDHKIMFDNG